MHHPVRDVAHPFLGGELEDAAVRVFLLLDVGELEQHHRVVEHEVTCDACGFGTEEVGGCVWRERETKESSTSSGHLVRGQLCARVWRAQLSLFPEGPREGRVEAAGRIRRAGCGDSLSLSSADGGMKTAEGCAGGDGAGGVSRGSELAARDQSDVLKR